MECQISPDCRTHCADFCLLLAFCIPFRSAMSIISKHKAGSSQESVSPSQLTAIIHDIFFATEKAGFYIDHKGFTLKSAISILSNLLWNIFDVKRQQNISLMELKLALLVLCELPPANTYHQLIDAHFDIAKDHNNCITRTRFEEFVNIFGKLLSYLGEPLYFERKVVSEIVNEVFENYPGINGMSQFTFTNLWTSHESTSFSNYTNLFLLLIRFKKSEQVVHHNQCSSCHTFPIVGMRFKCQKCKGLSLCFTCFSKGYVNSRHSLAHRMFELSSNEKERGCFQQFVLRFCSIFKSQPKTTLTNQGTPSDLTHNLKHLDGNTKLIENEHVELILIDDDMEGGTCARRGKRRGTIRSEIFNNSENLLILQRDLMEKLLKAVDSMRAESETFEKLATEKQKFLEVDGDVTKFIDKHNKFIAEHVDLLKSIQEAMVSSLSSSQNNKTIKSVFTSPTTSLFLPHSSTPYRTKKILKVFDPPTEIALSDSSECLKAHRSKFSYSNFLFLVNGLELNKSYVADNADYSVSDVSAWFQTKIPQEAKSKDGNKNLADETFETKVANFRDLLLKVREIIDGKLSWCREKFRLLMFLLFCRFIQRQWWTGKNNCKPWASRCENHRRWRKKS